MDAITDMLNAIVPSSMVKIVVIGVAVNTLLKGIHDAYDNTKPNANKFMWAIEFFQLLSGYLFLGKRPEVKGDSK